jgi:hypothetical protein
VAVPQTRPHHIPFNVVCRAAYEYGADYIVRINDDTEFLTEGWISRAIQTLESLPAPQRLGVVGPTCDQGNVNILTHDFVHAPTHLSIFADYYPDEFNNWWIDDWITMVYGKQRTKKLSDWRVHHHVGKHGTRYSVNHSQKRLLENLVQRGKRQIRHYLANGQRPDPNIYPVLGTDRVSMVAGPMAYLHQQRQEQKHHQGKR